MNLEAFPDLTELLTLAALAIPAIAAAAALLAVRSSARRGRLSLEAALADARKQADAAMAATATLESGIAALRHQVEQLEYRQERLATTGGHAGFRQAIALCRHGASLRELVESCGLSEGEAQLVHNLYGKDAATRLQEPDLH